MIHTVLVAYVGYILSGLDSALQYLGLGLDLDSTPQGELDTLWSRLRLLLVGLDYSTRMCST